MPLVATVAFVLLAAGAVPPPDGGETLIVSKRTFDCFVHDIERFAPRVRRRGIRVDITTCPTMLTEAFAPPDQPVETILDLDRTKFDCILRNRARIANFGRLDGRFYRIDLKRCAPPAP